ncbi:MULTISPECIES: hypothetical protein [Luteibacter]|uniref:hypothetical protein n=1 Tax=Luteibacter TaxID=242605 RepID=UPI0018CF14FD|nr:MULTISPECIES: hypothetical protein [unclassified Luteibacter]
MLPPSGQCSHRQGIGSPRPAQLKVPRNSSAASERVLNLTITPPGARRKKRDPRSLLKISVSASKPLAASWSRIVDAAGERGETDEVRLRVARAVYGYLGLTQAR